MSCVILTLDYMHLAKSQTNAVQDKQSQPQVTKRHIVTADKKKSRTSKDPLTADTQIFLKIQHTIYNLTSGPTFVFVINSKESSPTHGEFLLPTSISFSPHSSKLPFQGGK